MAVDSDQIWSIEKILEARRQQLSNFTIAFYFTKGPLERPLRTYHRMIANALTQNTFAAKQEIRYFRYYTCSSKHIKMLNHVMIIIFSEIWGCSSLIHMVAHDNTVLHSLYTWIEFWPNSEHSKDTLSLNNFS